MASVFLSYDREDAERRAPIALALEKAGHSVWWDRHIKGGAQYSKEIEEALKRPRRWSCCGRHNRSSPPGCATKPRRDATAGGWCRC